MLLNKARFDSRTQLIIKNVVCSIFVKGWSALVVLLMVPLTLSCLGVYVNGVWLTVSSILVWVDQMDIGLGNGLRNKLAACVARDDWNEGRKIVSSAVMMLLMISVIVWVLSEFIIWYVDIYSLLNVSEEIIPEFKVALLAAVTLVCMTFVMKFVSNVYMGVQLPSVSNFIMACGQTLALVGTWLLYHSGKADFLSIVIVNTTAPLMANMLIYPYTFYKRYPALRPSWKFVDMHVALGLANLGVKFFWLQIVGIVQFMTANILISIFFTPAAVTPYQITYRYISIVLVIFSVIFMPYWTATTDAYERGDIQWIRDANRRMNFFTVIIAVIIMFMVVVSPWVYDIWIGDKCEIPYEMTVMMGLYIFLIVSSMRYSYFLNGIGALRLQLIMSFLVIFYIPVLYLVNMYMHNILYFMVAMCMFTIPALVVNVIQLNKIISFRAKGIWRK